MTNCTLILSPLVVVGHMKLWNGCQIVRLTNVAIAKPSSLNSRENTTAGMRRDVQLLYIVNACWYVYTGLVVRFSVVSVPSTG